MTSNNSEKNRPPTYNCLSGGGEMEVFLRAIFSAESEMAGRMRAFDWSMTELGPPPGWPENLRTAVSLCLDSRFPIVIYWGPSLFTFYNDAYAPILATKHPWALGRPCREVWAEIWEVIGPQLDGVLGTGEATWSDDQLLILRRHGYPEECYFSFSFSPIRDGHGAVGGVFTAVTENTQRVVGQRRLRTLRDLAARSAEARSVEEACRITAEILGHNPSDVPFSLLYRVDGARDAARLVGASGLRPGVPGAPELVSLDGEHGASWPLADVARSHEVAVVEDVAQRVTGLPGGPWPDGPTTAVVAPIAAPGQGPPVALLVAGVSPRRSLDSDYRTFFELVTGHAASAIANADAYEAEQKRAEAEVAKKNDALREAHARMESVLASVTDTHILFDRQWRYVYVNEAAARAIGRPREQIVGRTLWEVFPDIIGTELDRQFHRAMDEGVPVAFDFHYATHDTWWANRFYPSPEGLTVFATDITDRKRAEEALRRAHEELEHRVLERTQELTAINAELVKEITERERVEAALREANGRVKLILDSITDQFFAFDSDW